MRGDEKRQGAMWSYVPLEQRIPEDHPLRPIRQMGLWEVSSPLRRHHGFQPPRLKYPRTILTDSVSVAMTLSRSAAWARGFIRLSTIANPSPEPPHTRRTAGAG